VDALKFKLTIAYDGTGYEGWQVQKSGTGVQEKVESALAKLFPSRPRLHSSSRTDTGVHALGMVAHFEAPKVEFRMPVRKLALAINAWLPHDIRVVSAQRTAKDFHARFQAKGKQYRYVVWNHPAMNPLLRTTAWHVTRPLDVKAMRAAAKLFVGKNDFQSFSANTGYERSTTVRTLTRCRGRHRLERDGRFLRRQDPHLAHLITHMLEKKDRRVAGMTAPAQGLVLWKVFYAHRPR